MTTPKKKPGRRPEHYTDSNGTPIEGLARRPKDGRWRIIGTNITFTEENEQRAIAKFHRLRQPGNVFPEHWERHPKHVIDPNWNFKDFNAPIIDDPNSGPRVYSEEELFVWFAEQIRERPKYVAGMT